MSSTRPGEGTLLGADFVAKPPPDVHTLCLVVTGHVINPSLCKNQPFDTVKDLAGVSRLVTRPIVIEATPGLPASNLKKSIELAKKQPDKLTCASPGSGSPTHLAGELRKAAAGIDMPHAPYKGLGPAYRNVFADRVKLMIDLLFSSLPHIKAGRMKPLAVISPQRSPRRKLGQAPYFPQNTPGQCLEPAPSAPTL